MPKCFGECHFLRVKQVPKKFSARIIGGKSFTVTFRARTVFGTLTNERLGTRLKRPTPRLTTHTWRKNLKRFCHTHLVELPKTAIILVRTTKIASCSRVERALPTVNYTGRPRPQRAAVGICPGGRRGDLMVGTGFRTGRSGIEPASDTLPH